LVERELKMLKPNASKIAKHAAVDSMVAEFLSRGGVIVRQKDAVASGLKKRRYIKRATTVKPA
jgi:hypothetical protein